MKHKAIVSIFKTFTPEELELFGRFINAPYHRNERILKSFYQVFKEFYPAFPPEKLNDSYIYSKIHPEKIFDEKHADSLIRVLTSELTSLAEKFLFHLNTIKDPNEYKVKLAEEMSCRGLNKLSLKNINDTISDIDNNNLDARLFNNLEKMFKYKQEYEYETADFIEQAKSIDKMTENFLFYIMSKASELIQTVNSEVYDLNAEMETNKLLKFFRNLNYDELLDSMVQLSGKYNYLYKMYLYLLRMLSGQVDSASFNEFQKLFKYNRKHLSRDEKHRLYLISMSLCGKLKCSGDGNFMCTCFDMHKNMLLENSFKPHDKGNMSVRVYRAIILAATLEKDFIWANNFVNEYTKELSWENRISMYNFAHANISFGMGNYEEALQYLSKINTGWVQLKYDTKCLLLKIYYELEYDNEFDYVLESLRQFLKNNSSVSEPKRMKYLNFINSTGKLMRYKHKRTSEPLISIVNEIIAIKEIAHKAWLLEKIPLLSKTINI